MDHWALDVAAFLGNLGLNCRFSSGDLTEYDDANGDPQQQQQQQPQPPPSSTQVHQQPALPPRPAPAPAPPGPSTSNQSLSSSQQQQVGPTAAAAAAGATAAAAQQPDLSLPLRPNSRTTSAPTSPAKSRESLLQRVSSLTSNVVSNVSRVTSAQIQQQQQTAESGKLPYNKDRCFTLLVIDDQNTDWSKYFRGRRIHGDWDVRVEQAEFRELSITASTDNGATVSMAVYRSGTKVVRAFRPDFVLIRQNMRDAGEDYKSIVLGLKFGGVPSINSLEAVYHFQDKPWVFGHLLDLQRRFGREQFPLIDQTFYPNHREMMSAPRLPAVLKIGHAHGGLGKLKVETPLDFQDAASVVAVSNSYCTVEPYVDSKFDIHIQKIGNYYKAFMRKSISGNWKTNLGSAMLEQTPMTDKYRGWIEAVAAQFGGLDLCALEVLVARDGREIIMELNDCALPLLGDSQEEDRRLISELVLHRMNTQCRPPGMPAGPSAGPASMPNAQSRHSITSGSRPESPADMERSSSAIPPALAGDDTGSVGSASQPTSLQQQSSRDVLGGGNPFLTRRGTEDGTPVTAGSLARSFFTRSSSQQAQEGSGGGTDDGEDTMKNLRKTFAGIFGDM
ncbi:synapsin-like [Daphnia pulex]|uniref:synapsin-like n=1 Tax=Daphnia pulex TaxID=6669 RepID=UPI001EDE1DFD|nr:synapsin-like [Daphnia pulex]